MRCYESSAVVIVISIMGELPLTYLNVSSVIARKHGCVLYSYLQKGSEQLRPAHTQSIINYFCNYLGLIAVYI